MAKSPLPITLLAAALCSLSLLSVARCSVFFVEGEVYCDTCRTRFQTRISELMEGATVRLECREREGGTITFSMEGVTNSSGQYRLEVDDDHEEELCEVVLAKSSRDDCNELADVGFGKNSARVSLTSNNGMANSARLANPLGFFKSEALPNCAAVLNEMGILPRENP